MVPVSIVEAPKFTQISLSEPYRSLSDDTATSHGMRFPFELCIPFYSGRSNGVPFLRRFFVRLTVLPYLQGFEVTYVFSTF